MPQAISNTNSFFSSLPNGKKRWIWFAAADAAFRRKKFIDFDWMEMKSINQLNLLKAERQRHWLEWRNQLSSRLLDWWVMGAAAPMAPPKRADGGRKRVGEWMKAKKESGMNQPTWTELWNEWILIHEWSKPWIGWGMERSRGERMEMSGQRNGPAKQTTQPINKEKKLIYFL